MPSEVEQRLAISPRSLLKDSSFENMAYDDVGVCTLAKLHEQLDTRHDDDLIFVCVIEDNDVSNTIQIFLAKKIFLYEHPIFVLDLVSFFSGIVRHQITTGYIICFYHFCM